jgi:HPr kinase/phosphorylase
MQDLVISALVEESGLELDVLTGAEGLDRKIFIPGVQKPGLILAGHLEHLNPEKVQILGKTEISYLSSLDVEVLRGLIDELMEHRICAFVVTRNLEPPGYFLKVAQKKGIPVIRSREKTSRLIRKLTVFLEERLAPQDTVHGVLMAIQGVGVLILGKSGIGKSESALDLVYKGHRLVADDLVFLQKIRNDVIIGYGSETIKHHMEIRGLGIINIKDLFGVVSVMDSIKVELIIELVDWDSPKSPDRLGLEEEVVSLLGVELPKVRIPVNPGRSLSVILEVAARNYLLKKKGFNAAISVDRALMGKLEESAGKEGG